MPLFMEKSKSKRGFQYKNDLIDLIEVLFDTSEFLFIKNKIESKS